MKALVKMKPGRGNVALQDVAVPKIGDGDVLMKVTFCGICGSDLHRESGLDPIPTPLILGHEYTGIVARLGRNVTRFKEGDPVSYRRAPHPWPGRERDGAFAEYLQVSADTLWKTPAGIPPEHACQFETVDPPIGLVKQVLQMQPEERVVVSGPGPLGLLTTNIARLCGASYITVLGGPGDEKVRLPAALRMGADEALPYGEETLAKLADDDAPTCWFETSGAAPAIEAAVNGVARGGRISVSGMGEGPWNVNMFRVARENISIHGRWGSPTNNVEEAARRMQMGQLRMEVLVTHIMPLSQWREAFDLLHHKEGIKIVLDPSR